MNYFLWFTGRTFTWMVKSNNKSLIFSYMLFHFTMVKQITQSLLYYSEYIPRCSIPVPFHCFCMCVSACTACICVRGEREELKRRFAGQASRSVKLWTLRWIGDTFDAVGKTNKNGSEQKINILSPRLWPHEKGKLTLSYFLNVCVWVKREKGSLWGSVCVCVCVCVCV